MLTAAPKKDLHQLREHAYQKSRFYNDFHAARLLRTDRPASPLPQPLNIAPFGTGDRYAAGRLTDLLVVRGDVEGLRERADAGDHGAARRLAGLLVMQGDVDGAIALLRPVADGGDGYAAMRLIELLTERGDFKGLRQWAAAGSGGTYVHDIRTNSYCQRKIS